ncbi:MAG: Cellulose-binding domain protein [Labilithrix sp.]|nr:Cellulose-binding domain protein [Labilithrix sp.]
MPDDFERRTSRSTRTTFVLVALGVAAGMAACSIDDENPGRLRDRNGGAEGTEVVPEASALLEPSAFGPTSLRRQNRAELRGSLFDIFGVDPAPLADLLPADVTGAETENPFDNDSHLQDVSTDLVVRLGSFAAEYAKLVLAKPARLLELGACAPAGAEDTACFDKIVRAAGRLAFRRKITADEVKRFDELMTYAKEDGDFFSAVDGFVQIVVQHPEFLYRIETGKPTATSGVFELEGREVATRLAFLLWGRVPDTQLLDAAETGSLATPKGRREQAERMLADPRAKEHWGRFHAQWLGYGNVTLPAALAADMKEETSKLLDLVVFEEKRPWLDVFTLDKTWVTPALAKHYGIAAPAQPVWVPYEGQRGGGILAHGDFLLQGSKFGDTSPTLRGYRMLKRLLCKELGAIPPGIDTDNPPAGGSPTDCKPKRYNMRDNAACASCHTQTDNIGFGLENFGPSGEWRETEPGLTSCAIDGKGRLLDKEFSGPRELGAALASLPDLASCADRQLFRFAVGRADANEDARTLQALDAQLAAVKDLGSMVRALTDTPAITYRVERSTP